MIDKIKISKIYNEFLNRKDCPIRLADDIEYIIDEDLDKTESFNYTWLGFSEKLQKEVLHEAYSENNKLIHRKYIEEFGEEFEIDENDEQLVGPKIIEKDGSISYAYWSTNYHKSDEVDIDLYESFKNCEYVEPGLYKRI